MQILEHPPMVGFRYDRVGAKMVSIRSDFYRLDKIQWHSWRVCRFYIPRLRDDHPI